MREFHNPTTTKQKRKQLRKNLMPQEIILWSRLKKSQLGCKFRRQHGIGNYIVDFYCPEKKLVIELDGSQHSQEDNIIYDRERTKFIESKGIKVIRFWDNEINNELEQVLEKIRRELGD